jgi:hypothetical protein
VTCRKKKKKDLKSFKQSVILRSIREIPSYILKKLKRIASFSSYKLSCDTSRTICFAQRQLGIEVNFYADVTQELD